MKLQTRSAIERESEQRLELLMRPALPGATTTTFGGLKRQKALNTQLQLQDLGIKRKPTTERLEMEKPVSLVGDYASSSSEDSSPDRDRDSNPNPKDS